nr:GNAT family N-acetyltransferase [Syntrophales bacterium]
MLRKAKTSDVKLIHRIINLSAAKGEMLPRSLVDLYNSLRDFYVYMEEDNGPIVGVVAMHLFWENLAEIRSLYVADEYRKKGIGKKLVEACISEAITLEIYRIFALTYQKDF